MKIAFVISTLAAGGAERVAAILCNRWAEQGHSVSLITFENAAAPSHYALHPALKRIPLDLLHTNSGEAMLAVRSAQRIRRLRLAIKQLEPDIVVSFMVEQNVLTIIATRGLGVPVIVSERVHPGFHAIGRVRSLVRKLVYPRASAVVVQTAEIAHWFEQYMQLKCAIIANPIELERYASAKCTGPSPEKRRLKAMAIGRLEPQKGFDILIQAFARVAPEHPDWDLDIFGEGSERANLTRLIDQNGLNSRVRLAGTTDKVSDELIDADLFVHSSLYEGYPNVVAEALASNRCVLATDSPGGTAELLAHGKYGMLVPPGDAEAFAAGLDELMSDAGKRDRFSRQASDTVQSLSADLIADKWIDLFHNSLQKPLSNCTAE